MLQSGLLPHGFVLQTKDLEEAASLLSDAAIPYKSELLPGSPSFATEIFVTHGQHVSVSRVVTSGLMHVEACLPKDAYAIVLDLRSGVGLHRVRDHQVVVDGDSAFVQSPLQIVDVLTPPGFEALFLRISRDALIEELQRLLDREVHAELLFAPAFGLLSSAGVRLRNLSRELRRMLCATGQAEIAGSLSLSRLEQDLIRLLLEAQPHNYTRLLNRRSEAGSFQLDAAEEFMRGNAHLPLSLGEVCRAAGINARTLQHSFRNKRGCTPMEFLRKFRMEQVRAALSQPNGETSVSGEASRWGFLHFGRFSREYRILYGELPSATLRRARNIKSSFADDLRVSC